jgi:hypothetical protein
LEEAMIDGGAVLKAAIADAVQPGPIETPEGLLAAVEAQAQPLRALSDWDASNEIFAALFDQFGFLRLAQTTGKPLEAEDFGRLAALIRWIMRECTDWATAADPKRARLTALFVAAQVAGVGEKFWAACPADLAVSEELLAELGRLFASLNISFATPAGLPPPIWEAEAVERYSKADAEGDWIGIAQGWRLIEDRFFPGVLVAQATQCIGRFAPERMIEAVTELRQTAAAMAIALSLDPTSALRLAAVSDNPHVQFAGTHRAISVKANRSPLDQEGHNLLTQLLVRVSGDRPRWAAWMQVFNFFPSWFPALQEPLGRALASADDEALKAYVDPISLHWSNKPVDSAVTECLRSFRREAPLGRRRVLWGFAYHRWKTWQFGLKEADGNLVKLARSDLDFAIVGYALEVLDATGRQETLAALWQRLLATEDAWYADLTACRSEWNCILSEYQPFVLADSIAGTDAEWVDWTMRLPFSPQNEPYLMLKYGEPTFF